MPPPFKWLPRLFPHSQDLITQALAESPLSTCPGIHLFTHSFIHCLTHPHIQYLSIYPTPPHPSTHPSSHWSSHPSTRPPTPSTHPCTHLLTKPSALHTHPSARSFTPHPSSRPSIHPSCSLTPLSLRLSKEQILDTVCQVQFPTSLCASGSSSVK